MLLLGAEKHFGVRVDVSNPDPGEDAHQAKLIVNLSPNVHFGRHITLSASGAVASCTDELDETTLMTKVECSLGNPFKKQSEISLVIQLVDAGNLTIVEDFGVTTQLLTSGQQDGHDEVLSFEALVRVEAQIKVT